MLCFAMSEKKYFSDALFENVDFSFFTEDEEAIDTNTVQNESEKNKVLKSLKDYVGETPSNSVDFKEGQISVKEKIDLIKSVSVFSECQNCAEDLISGRPCVYFEEKVVPTKVMFVGDYPKKASNQSGQVFSGEVREQLLKMISAMKLSENEFVLSLMIKCPVLKEANFKTMKENCLKNLEKEIAYYRPQFVITLGSVATTGLIGEAEKLATIHGQFYSRTLALQNGEEHSYTIMPLFHPELLLVNTNIKKAAWEDMKKVMAKLGKL